MEFFFISCFQAGCPVEVSKDPFPHYIGKLGNLHPKGMLIVVILFLIIFILNRGHLTTFLSLLLFTGVR